MSGPEREQERVDTVVLGAGVTGLAAGRATGGTVYEAADGPGGICRSYYVVPGSAERLDRAPEGGGAYRFEVGGGHWIFGGEPAVLDWLEGLVPTEVHERRAEVHFASSGTTVPYPIQDHLDAISPGLAAQVADERSAPPPGGGGVPVGVEPTMAEWLVDRFGATLADRFFLPFNARYTAGLHTSIAPQDAYKSPTDRSGYNVTFRYPVGGLDEVARAMAAGVDVRYGRRVVGIDPAARSVAFADGSTVSHRRLISTLPLDVAIDLGGAGSAAAALGPPDPHTSVLVANIGAVRGPTCPDAHWVYEPEAAATFHRYGVYSNVDRSFVPHGRPDRVALYVEHAFVGGDRPSPAEEAAILEAAVAELTGRGIIGPVEVLDASWVDRAYTWRRPGSTWAADALAVLDDLGVEQVGRYARWHFQGIAESIADGLAVGGSAS